MFKKLMAVVFVAMLIATAGCRTTTSNNNKSNIDSKKVEFTTPTYDKPYTDNEDMYPEYTRVPNHMPDPTKTDSTGWMCWAMASCAVLEYNGYESDWKSCINLMGNKYGNTTNNVYTALKWYFGDEWSKPEVYVNMNGSQVDVIEFTMDQIDAGNPVIVRLRSLTVKTGHLIAVFGYSMNDVGDEIYFRFVEGEDDYHTANMTVTEQEDGSWKNTLKHTGMEIDYALTLLPRR